jgi:hypothetical protein
LAKIPTLLPFKYGKYLSGCSAPVIIFAVLRLFRFETADSVNENAGTQKTINIETK